MIIDFITFNFYIEGLIIILLNSYFLIQKLYDKIKLYKSMKFYFLINSSKLLYKNFLDFSRRICAILISPHFELVLHIYSEYNKT
jgi:hypothetical protein